MKKVKIKLKQTAEIIHDFECGITDLDYDLLGNLSDEEVIRWIESPDGQTAIINRKFELLDEILDRSMGDVVGEEKFRNVTVEIVKNKIDN